MVVLSTLINFELFKHSSAKAVLGQHTFHCFVNSEVALFSHKFLVGNFLGIYIDPSLRYYFDNNQPKSIRTAQPLMFGFEMGLRARL